MTTESAFIRATAAKSRRGKQSYLSVGMLTPLPSDPLGHAVATLQQRDTFFFAGTFVGTFQITLEEIQHPCGFQGGM